MLNRAGSRCFATGSGNGWGAGVESAGDGLAGDGLAGFCPLAGVCWDTGLCDV